jgi:hypothetical protein
MTRDSLKRLSQALKDLRDYLKANESLSQISRIDAKTLDGDAASIIESVRNAMLSPAKAAQFLYSSVIIELYGCLEAYVEDLIEDYVRELNRLVSRYADLPKGLKANHRRLSGLFADRIESKANPGLVTVADVIANLHSCLSGANGFVINAEAFAYHTANVRVPIVEKMFVDAGSASIMTTIGSDPRFRSVKDAIDPDTADLFFRINDLADRRNEVAHGAPSELLSVALLAQYIEVMDAFANALFNATAISLMPYARSTIAVNIGSPYQILRAGRVALFDLQPGNSVHVNDTIVAYSGDMPIRAGAISSLQVDNANQISVTPAVPLKVGFGIDFRCKKRWEYWILPG